MSDRLPGLYRNYVSLAGAALALASLASIVFLFLADMLGGREKPYLGIVAYMVMPAFLILGLAVLIAGMVLERKRRRKLAISGLPAYPRIDLNDPRARRGFSVFVSFTFIFLFASAVGSYRAYETTDSVAFCGQLCHSVMKPEFVAYTASPHARVRCVDCHVGPGATWYVRSKLSGLYQVYAVAFNKYPRPIPTPVANLRPAQETCEQCHWPEKFFGAQLKVFNHFGSDENNTPRQIQMLIKTGGGSPTTGITAGIHWHMNIANKVTYIASDDQRQVIPWVRMKDMYGNVTDYKAQDSKLTAPEIESATKRVMDCVDCHNRPSHIFVPPDRSVDSALVAGRIDISLPYIKQQAVDALTREYASTAQAVSEIATYLDNYYKTSYPEVYSSKQKSVQAAIAEVQQIFQTTMFPEMKVDWRTHRENIGHFYSAGCFRCHDGQHVSADGKVIRKDCDICHTVLGQQEGGKPMAEMKGAQFQHPLDLGDMTQVSCMDCHTGGKGP